VEEPRRIRDKRMRRKRKKQVVDKLNNIYTIMASTRTSSASRNSIAKRGLVSAY
jgi:hypothetical protein